MNTILSGDLQPCAGAGCFELVDAPTIELFDRRLNFKVMCPVCEQKWDQAQNDKAKQESVERFKIVFDGICPPLYRDTDLARIYAPFAEIAKTYHYSPTGVFLEGPPGTGKTRAAWHILRRMIEAGKSCYGLTSTQFAKAASDQWHSDPEDKGDALQTMSRCRRAAVLLIDDLGKQKMTERGETELYDVLEHRTTNLQPTIVTTNANGAQLAKMLSEDRRQPIMRRIRDFSQFIKFNP